MQQTHSRLVRICVVVLLAVLSGQEERHLLLAVVLRLAGAGADHLLHLFILLLQLLLHDAVLHALAHQAHATLEGVERQYAQGALDNT